MKNINKLQMFLSERTPVVFTRHTRLTQESTPCRKGGSQHLGTANVSAASLIQREASLSLPDQQQGHRNPPGQRGLSCQAKRSRQQWSWGHMDNEGPTAGSNCVAGERGAIRPLNTRLPGPESQGSSKFKFLLHSPQSAPSFLSLEAPHCRLPPLTQTPRSPAASLAPT